MMVDRKQRQLAVAERNYVALEREGCSLRLGYMNADKTLGPSVLVQQTTVQQDMLIAKWAVLQVEAKTLLSEMVSVLALTK